MATAVGTTQPATVVPGTVVAQPAAGGLRSADERAHLRTNDQLGADGIAGHVRAVSRTDCLADSGSDGLANDTGAISVADRRADEGAHHRPHRRDSVKCT